MKTTLSPASLQDITTRLEKAHKAFQNRYPGAAGDRQPVHTVYGGAHLFRADTARRLGETALRSLDEFAPDFISFAKIISLAGADRLPDSPQAAAAIAQSIEAASQSARKENQAAWFAHTLYQRVREKLRREPVEDFRIDFEDGYGNRPDEEEDGHAAAVAGEIAAGMNSGELPPFIGIRIKPFTEELRDRSIRTMDIVLTELTAKTHGKLPDKFYITLPKVSLPDEVAALADICARLEPALDLEPGALRLELMIETTQSIFNEHGQVNHFQRARAGEPAAACERGARTLRRGALWDLRLHGRAKYHRCLSTDDSSRVRFCARGDASGACGHRRLAVRWRNEYPSGSPASRRKRRLGAAAARSGGKPRHGS